jgi:hypothetical protein
MVGTALKMNVSVLYPFMQSIIVYDFLVFV